MCSINIADKESFDPFFPIGAKRFGYHYRTQVTSPNANIHDVPDFFTGISFPFIAM